MSIIVEKVMKRIKKSAQAQILRHFPSCPLCHKNKSIRIYWGGASTGKVRDILACSNCNARWRFYSDLSGNVCWAKLDRDSVDGKAKFIMGERRRLEFWRNLAIDGSLIERLQMTPAKDAFLCPSCGYKNPIRFNYCGRCGAELIQKDETRIY